MQWTSPVFSDIRFRKALNLAIDKEAIIKQLFAGLAEPVATYPGSNISVVGGDPTLKPYPYDPQEARRLIKEGGWEGYEFTMVSYDRAGCPGVSEGCRGSSRLLGKDRVEAQDTHDRVGRLAKSLASDPKIQNTIHGYDGPIEPGHRLRCYTNLMREVCTSRRCESAVNIPELNERFEKIDKEHGCCRDLKTDGGNLPLCV